MNPPSKVLVVAQDSGLASTLGAWLNEAGCDLEVSKTFDEGREQLEDSPAIVMAEIRLGAYNGLHLALRARAKGIPAVIVGDSNPVTEREAERLGVAYLKATDLKKDEVQLLIRALTNSDDADSNAAPTALPFSVAWAIAVRTSGAAALSRFRH